MANMTSEQIRDIAVGCVEGFLNDKTPLSIGLAKAASANDLNLEQIKRACEVTNTVTHLKLMQLSDDRTIEFPMCKVAEVMSAICLPGEKQAAAAKHVVANDLTATNETLVKAASDEGDGFAISDHEKTVYFIKEAALNEKALEALQDRSIMVQSELVKVASEVRKDSAWMDKLSSVSTEDFAELSVLISGQKEEARDFGGYCMFKEAELKQVNKLALLYKEARAIVAEKAKRANMCKRADELSQELTKKAFFKTVGSTLGKGVVGAAGLAAGATALGAKKAAKFATSGVGTAVISDSITHAAAGGAGVTSHGASKNVWDALQN